jgi:hypothetical protein
MRKLVGSLLLSFACGPQVATDGDGDDTDDAMDDDDAGERPSAGAMYSACSTVDECAPLEFCVFPTREGGYCSAACVAAEDPSACAEAPGDTVTVSCLDIGTPDGRTACALDCSDGPCPHGMTCEAIATPSGQKRDICF